MFDSARACSVPRLPPQNAPLQLNKRKVIDRIITASLGASEVSFGLNLSLFCVRLPDQWPPFPAAAPFTKAVRVVVNAGGLNNSRVPQNGLIITKLLCFLFFFKKKEHPSPSARLQGKKSSLNTSRPHSSVGSQTAPLLSSSERCSRLPLSPSSSLSVDYPCNHPGMNEPPTPHPRLLGTFPFVSINVRELARTGRGYRINRRIISTGSARVG